METPRIDDIIKNHMVEGFLDSSKLHDEDVLNTMNEEAKLRITVYNTYPKKQVMANCARVTSTDHFSTSGIVHNIDKVILPATKTIADIINSDAQFTKLSEILKKTDLLETLLSSEGQFTLFAPTDEAIAKLDENTYEKFMAGNGCSQDILKHHLLPNVICTGVIESKAKTLNILNKYMLFERDDEDNLFIDETKIIIRDIVGINGVIHVLDEVLIPESARSVDVALEERQSTILQGLFEIAEISEEIDVLSNSTIFAPSEKALLSLPKAFMDDLKADKSKLKEFLMYHVATPKTCQCDFENNKRLDSGITDKKLRINMYGAVPFSLLDASPRQISTVQCARLTSLDDEICGGMIHTVDKVLLPPGGNIVEVIKSSGTFAKFMELIEFAELENELNLEGPYTILAPTDRAFEHISDSLTDKAFSDKDAAVKLVKNHILSDMVCCAGITRHIPFLDLSGHRTQNGDIISLRRSRGGHIYAERSELTTCDMVADNGVVHTIDRLLVPDQLDQDGVDDYPETTNRRRSPFDLFNLFN